MRTRPDLQKEFIRLHRARNSSKNYYICESRVFGAMKRIIITLLAFVLSSFTLSFSQSIREGDRFYDGAAVKLSLLEHLNIALIQAVERAE